MALSDRTQYALHVALGKDHGQEVVTAIAAQVGAAASHVAALGALGVAPLGDQTDLVGVDGTGNDAAPLTTVQTQIDALQVKLDAAIAAMNTVQVKLDAVITSLTASGLMAAS